MYQALYFRLRILNHSLEIISYTSFTIILIYQKYRCQAKCGDEPLTPSSQKAKEEGSVTFEFMASLIYVASSQTAVPHRETLSQKHKNKNKPWSSHKGFIEVTML